MPDDVTVTVTPPPEVRTTVSPPPSVSVGTAPGLAGGATEETLGDVVTALARAVDELGRLTGALDSERIRVPTPASVLSYARDRDDRMRVSVDNAAAFILHRTRLGNVDLGAFPLNLGLAPFAEGTGLMLDQRTEQAMRSRALWATTRSSRWKVT